MTTEDRSTQLLHYSFFIPRSLLLNAAQHNSEVCPENCYKCLRSRILSLVHPHSPTCRTNTAADPYLPPLGRDL